jgi:hypothetical protein
MFIILKAKQPNLPVFHRGVENDLGQNWHFTFCSLSFEGLGGLFIFLELSFFFLNQIGFFMELSIV